MASVFFSGIANERSYVKDRIALARSFASLSEIPGPGGKAAADAAASAIVNAAITSTP